MMAETCLADYSRIVFKMTFKLHSEGQNNFAGRNGDLKIRKSPVGYARMVLEAVSGPQKHWQWSSGALTSQEWRSGPASISPSLQDLRQMQASGMLPGRVGEVHWGGKCENREKS